MRVILFLLALLCALPARGAEMMQQIVNDTHHSAGAGYTGPGDVQTYQLFYSLMAYSAATAGVNNVAEICNAGDVHCGFVGTNSDGTFKLSTVTAAPFSCTDKTCTVRNLCEVSANDCATNFQMFQLTEANRFQLCFTCVNGSPGLYDGGGAVSYSTVTAKSISASPNGYTYEDVFSTPSFTSGSPQFAVNPPSSFLMSMFGGGAQVDLFAGGAGVVGPVLSTSTLYAVAATVDSTGNSCQITANASAGTAGVCGNGGSGGSAQFLVDAVVGNIMGEFGIYLGSTNQSTVIANARTRYGF